MHKSNKLSDERVMWHMYLADFIHPIAGKLKHEFTGLYCSRHGGGVGGREQPQISAITIAAPALHRKKLSFTSRDGFPVVVLLFLLLSNVGGWRSERERERERPRAEFQRSAVAQVGAASSLSDTEAGSRCTWSIYT